MSAMLAKLKQLEFNVCTLVAAYEDSIISDQFTDRHREETDQAFTYFWEQTNRSLMSVADCISE